MDKTIGYREITVNGEGNREEVIPLKFGLLAIERYALNTGIDFNEIAQNTFEHLKKTPITIYANILLAGAQCYQILNEGKEYTLKDAHRWVDALGIYSGDMVEVFHTFLESILPPKLDEIEVDESDEFDRPKKKKNSRSKG